MSELKIADLTTSSGLPNTKPISLAEVIEALRNTYCEKVFPNSEDVRCTGMFLEDLIKALKQRFGDNQ